LSSGFLKNIYNFSKKPDFMRLSDSKKNRTMPHKERSRAGTEARASASRNGSPRMRLYIDGGGVGAASKRKLCPPAAGRAPDRHAQAQDGKRKPERIAAAVPHI
jgi:hypothetical protein